MHKLSIFIVFVLLRDCELSDWIIQGDSHLRMSFTVLFAFLVHTCNSIPFIPE